MNEEEEQLVCESCQVSMDEDNAHSTHDSRLICSDCVLYCENCEMAGDEMDDLALVDKETGATHDFNLSWDRDNGYDIEFHNPLSDTLIDMKNRPEFEYVLDCIMREDEDNGD